VTPAKPGPHCAGPRAVGADDGWRGLPHAEGPGGFLGHGASRAHGETQRHLRRQTAFAMDRVDKRARASKMEEGAARDPRGTFPTSRKERRGIVHAAAEHLSWTRGTPSHCVRDGFDGPLLFATLTLHAPYAFLFLNTAAPPPPRQVFLLACHPRLSNVTVRKLSFLIHARVALGLSLA